MKLIIGLGNPGPEYAKSRHNAGFMVVDRLAARHRLTDAGPARMKFHAGVLEGVITGEKCLVMQPMTFMNKSGLAVGEAAAFYKLEPRDVLIVVDDLALDCGKIRLRAEGGTGGHNGLVDVERALGTQAYPRLRVGIDSRGRIPQVDYVLGRLSLDQESRLAPALDQACDAIECWLRDGIDTAMTRFNPKSEPPTPPDANRPPRPDDTPQ